MPVNPMATPTPALRYADYEGVSPITWEAQARPGSPVARNLERKSTKGVIRREEGTLESSRASPTADVASFLTADATLFISKFLIK